MTQDPREKGDPVVINLLADPTRAIVGSVVLTPDGITTLVQESLDEEPGRPIILRASRALAYGAVRPYIDACRGGGAVAIELAAEGQ